MSSEHKTIVPDVQDPKFTHISKKIEIRESPCGGYGWFALEDLEEGEWVWRNQYSIPRRFVKKKDLASLTEEEGHQLLQHADDLYEVVSRDEPNYYQNHSCDPTTWFKGEEFMVTSRAVKKGEELTYDYCLSESDYDDPVFFTCSCGSPLCRGDISSEDYKRAELQERYGNHFAPYILEKIQLLKAKNL
eukprot:TRINITY_DN1670_c0_g1_i1.p1 TRINITY_DN1670_c0_g1~~TRINITY_DN1670_c0_g1_i1.p1  ORF type:complete len:189 (+),score=33.44 TRINITY_DN1670_c0_g1_i1:30-596(+)